MLLFPLVAWLQIGLFKVKPLSLIFITESNSIVNHLYIHQITNGALLLVSFPNDSIIIARSSDENQTIPKKHRVYYIFCINSKYHYCKLIGRKPDSSKKTSSLLYILY